MKTHATPPKSSRSARARKDSTPTKSKSAPKNTAAARKNAATPRKNAPRARQNAATTRHNTGATRHNAGSTLHNAESPLQHAGSAPQDAAALQNNADPLSNYTTGASNIPVPHFDRVPLPLPRRTGRQVDDLALAIERAEVRLRWAWSERAILAPALPADFHETAWTALGILHETNDETADVAPSLTYADDATADALPTPAARALETLRAKLSVIRGAVEFTTRPGDPERDALRFGTVLRATRGILRVAPDILKGARSLRASFPALTDDVIEAADHALVTARKAVSRARRQGVSASVSRGAAAEREQRALDVLLDRIDHLRAAALTRLAPLKPTLAALLMAPLEASRAARASDDEPATDGTDTHDDPNDDPSDE